MNVTTVLATLHMRGLHTLQMVPEVVTRADDMLNSTINTRGGGLGTSSMLHTYILILQKNTSVEVLNDLPNMTTHNPQETGPLPPTLLT